MLKYAFKREDMYNTALSGRENNIHKAIEFLESEIVDAASDGYMGVAVSLPEGKFYNENMLEEIKNHFKELDFIISYTSNFGPPCFDIGWD